MPKHAAQQQNAAHSCPGLEPLEPRVMLSGTSYLVNSLADAVAADGVVTLREAIEAANTNLAVNEAPAGSDTEADIITFDQAALQTQAGPGNPLVITLDGTQLEITDDLAIQGLGAEVLTVDADGQSRVVHVSGAETEADLTGLTITGGLAADANGGGIHVGGGTVRLTNTTVSGNSATGNRWNTGDGGGIYNGGTLTLTNSTVSGNLANDDGGGICNWDGTVTLTHTTVSGNSAEYGGGIYNDEGTVTLNNAIVALNDAPIAAAVYTEYDYADLRAHRSLVGANPGFVRDPSAGADGVWGTADDDYGDLRLTDTSLAINMGDDALAVDGDGLPLTMDLDGNPRVVHGQVDIGAYEFQGTPSPARESPSTIVTTLTDVLDTTDGEISLREACVYAGFLEQDVTFAADLSGGAIVLGGRELSIYQSLTIDATSIGGVTVDAAEQSRVVLIAGPSEVSLMSLTIVGGATPDWGGGIANGGTLTLINSTVSGNSADYGGGIANGGTLTLMNSTVSGNSASGDGGGIYNGYGTVTLLNSTVSGNSANGDGGGICNDDYGEWVELTLTNSTVSGNSANGNGGGIYSSSWDSWMLTLDNTIVALNSAPSHADIRGMSTRHSSLVGTDPLFVRDPFDGGDGWGDDPATPGIDESANDDYGDLRLQPGSPAIDAGDNALLPADEFDLDGDGNVAEPLPVDIAGAPRVRGENVDMGAYESPIRFIVDSLADIIASDGVVTLREAIQAANTNTAVTADVLAGSGTFQDVVTFDQAALSVEAGVPLGQPVTITLRGTQLDITDDLAIQGLGVGVLVVDADGRSRVVSVSSSRVELTGLTITGGNSTVRGGGIYNSSGTLTLTNTEVSGNSSAGQSGGGIYNEEGTLTLTSTKVSGNSSAGQSGGGVYNEKGTLALTNSVVSSNLAHDGGGGIYNEEGTLTLANTTVSGNSADLGGGIHNYDGAVTLSNTIVALNDALASPDIHGSSADSSSLIGVDPSFVRDPSAGADGVWGTVDDDNGDLRLGPTSPAIDAGDNALLPADEHDLDGDGIMAEVLPMDIDGNSRILDGSVDIGAYERTYGSVSYVVNSLADVVASDGVVTLREAIQAANTDASVTDDVLAGSATEADNITFDQAALQIEAGPGNPLIITLDGQQLEITSDLDIQGLGADTLAVDAGGRSRVFHISGEDTEVDLTGLTITGGAATLEDGGGIYNDSGTLALMNVTVSDNLVAGKNAYGGGICNNSGIVILTNTTVSRNSATATWARGGGIYTTASGWLALTDSNVSGNSAHYGGGIYNNDSGTVILTNTTVSDNTARTGSGHGGGIFILGTLIMKDSTVSNNLAGWYGSGIYGSGTLTLTDSTVSHNSNEGIRASGTLTLTGSTVSGNSNDGIHASGTLTLTGSTMSGNSGDGIDVGSGTVTATNVTVSSNSARGISNGSGTLTLTNSTVSSNCGGGVSRGSGTLTLNNTIIALNGAPSGADVSGSYTGHNNLVGVDPGFVRNPSAGEDGVWGTADDDYGDLRLRDTSLAVNRGDDALAVDGDGLPLTTDRNGRPRVVHGQVDVGAYEYQGTAPLWEVPSTVVTTLIDVVDTTDGEISLREACVYGGPLEQDVTFATGLSGGTMILGGRELYIDQSLTIDASSIGGVTLDASGQSRVVLIRDHGIEVSLTHLTLTGGSTVPGGAIHNASGALTLTNVTISGNSGGGIHNVSGTLTLTNVTVSDNSGEGIRNASGALTLTNVTVLGNSGGGIHNASGALTLADSAMSDNSGEGIRNASGTLTMTNVTVSDNSGGGIQNTSGTLTLVNATVSGNSAASDGGGIYNYQGTVTLTNATVSGNSAASDGGGIYNYQGTVTLTNATVSDNSADEDGGGIYSYHKGTVTLTNTTVSGNCANEDGGGIYHHGGGTLALTNATVSGNSANSDGGGIYQYGTLTLNNTIVALNNAPASADIYGDLTAHSSLVGVNPGFVRNPSAGADGVWGTADDDVGDLRLKDTSLAINLGNDALAVDGDGLPLMRDRDGNPRVVDGSVDIGAYEYQGAPSARRESPSTVVTTLADTVDTTDGRISIREACVHASSTEKEVTFAADLSGGTIVLSGRELYVLESLTIDATSVGGLSIDATGRSRVMLITGSDIEVSLASLTLTGGSTTGSGGGIYSTGMLTLTDVAVLANSAGKGGGGIYSSGTLTGTNATVSGNSANGLYHGGGGIYSSSGSLTIVSSTVADNSARSGGGGIKGFGTLTDSTVSGNSAKFGGGISGSVTLTNVTVSGNSAWSSVGGGGIYGHGTLTNVTVSGNSGGGSGGINTGPDRGMLTLTNSTVLGNSGYGIYNNGEVRVKLTNSAVLGNSGGIHSNAPLTLTSSTVSGGIRNGNPFNANMVRLNNTVVDGISGRFINNSSLVGVDPLFVRNPSRGPDGVWGTADDDYGDLRLQPGSPAIDAGDNALLPADEFDLDGDGDVTEVLPVDLAGGPRVLGPRVDIGAYEGAVVVAEIFGDSVDALVAGGPLALGEGDRLELVIGGGGDEFVAGTYTLIEAAGGLTGEFAGVTNLGDYVSAGPNGDGLVYDPAAGTVSLVLDRSLNPGDANLDCVTDVLDRIIWNEHNFTAGTTFITGDFDADGFTDVSDRIIWNSHNFTLATASPAPLPAPVADLSAAAASIQAGEEDASVTAALPGVPVGNVLVSIQTPSIEVPTAAGPFSSDVRSGGTVRAVDAATPATAQLDPDMDIDLLDALEEPLNVALAAN